MSPQIVLSPVGAPRFEMTQFPRGSSTIHFTQSGLLTFGSDTKGLDRAGSTDRNHRPKREPGDASWDVNDHVGGAAARRIAPAPIAAPAAMTHESRSRCLGSGIGAAATEDIWHTLGARITAASPVRCRFRDLRDRPGATSNHRRHMERGHPPPVGQLLDCACPLSSTGLSRRIHPT